MDAPSPSPLRVLRAAQIPDPSVEAHAWLVEPLWSAGAVGLIGGAPKSGKTWLALELAVAVGSGCRCLGRFTVPRPARYWCSPPRMPPITSSTASAAWPPFAAPRSPISTCI